MMSETWPMYLPCGCGGGGEQRGEERAEVLQILNVYSPLEGLLHRRLWDSMIMWMPCDSCDGHVTIM